MRDVVLISNSFCSAVRYLCHSQPLGCIKVIVSGVLIDSPGIPLACHDFFILILQAYAKEAKRKYGVDMYFLIERLDTASENADERIDVYLMLQEQLEQQQKQKKKLRKLFRELGEVMDADGKSRRNYDYYGARFV